MIRAADGPVPSPDDLIIKTEDNMHAEGNKLQIWSFEQAFPMRLGYMI
jgi:hypothetical protein